MNDTATTAATADALPTILAEATVPVLVEFWADWCQHCKAMAPVLERFAAKQADALRVVTVNAEENRALAEQHGVNSLPTMILFKQGQPVTRTSGATSEVALLQTVKPHL